MSSGRRFVFDGQERGGVGIEAKYVYQTGEPTYQLTPRQIEILERVSCGESLKGIAAALGIQYQTVKNHLNTIRRALGATSTSHAVRLAKDRKLINTCGG